MGNETEGTTVIDAYAHLDMEHPNPAEDLREQMRDAGVERAVVVETWDGRNRAAVRQVIDRYPADCCGVFCFRKGSENPVLATLGDPGVAGIRIRTADLELPNAILPSLEVSGKSLVVHAEGGIGVVRERLLRVVAHYPRIRIYLPHLGWPRQSGQNDPDWRAAMSDFAAVPGCIVGISAIAEFSRESYPHADVYEYAAQLCEGFGADRLLVGSDYPLFEKGRYSAYIHLAHSWFQSLAGREESTAAEELCARTNRANAR
jgi:predicted TIM-barrel fold metal-dependent hydrolase